MRCLLYLFLLFPAAITAQDTVQHVVGSAGDDFQTATTMVSWTLGEVISESGESSSYTVNQGFHQGNLLVDYIYEDAPEDCVLKVYPNPVKNLLTIEAGDKNLFYEVIDASGRIRLDGIISSVIKQIDFTGLPAGTYFLKVEKHITHKIIKP